MLEAGVEQEEIAITAIEVCELAPCFACGVADKTLPH